MRILFIQLSDIHFKANDNYVISKFEKLYEALRNKVLSTDKVIILINGDSAFSGKVAEFEIAYTFFNNLKRKLYEYSQADIDIITIPGNHDCDFADDSKLREAVIKSIEKLGEEGIDESIINAVCITQKNYNKYADSLNPLDELIYNSKLNDIYKYNIGGKLIIISCLNSSYVSQIHEKAGTMYFPASIFDNDLLGEKADLSICCIHHPLHWLIPENRREIKNKIEKFADVCFTGHEHEFTKSAQSDLEGNITYYIEGSVLQDSLNKDNSGFNTILFDLYTDKFLIENYKWDIQSHMYDNNYAKSSWLEFHRNMVKHNPYELNKSFGEILNDIGANVNHPNVSAVKLLDLYVYPRLELVDYSDNKKNSSINITEDSEAIVKALDNNIRLFFVGPENIGKSTLLKIIYQKLHSKGSIPILIEGGKINSTNIDDFNTLSYNYFKKQYVNNVSKEEFNQIDKGKIVIIIDDFHRVKLNQKFVSNLLTNLLARYVNVIITSNELTLIEDIILENVVYKELHFNLYKIKEFGHLLKARLINKWIVLGKQETISEQERIQKLNRAELTVKVVTGRNLVPNYPIFILTLLQALEIGSPTDLTASTFGHYYQFLIQRSFGNVLSTQDEITNYNNYLSELAFHFFKKKVREISYDEFEEFDKDYRDKYTIPHSIHTIINKLLDARMIEKFDSSYEFKYLYIYYFFVSKYFAENITEETVKIYIEAIIKRIYRTDFANILLFLTHHTRDKFLLEKVLNNAQDLFNNYKPCELEIGNKNIGDLASKVPDLVYKQRSVDEYREEINNEQDIKDVQTQSEIDNELSQAADINEDVSKIDIVAKLNLAFKTIEVLGQILKNNYGKIPNPTVYKLVEETYLLGLRTLELHIKFIDENTEIFINYIEDYLKDKHITDTRKLKIISKRILFRMITHLAYTFIKKVSNSLGTENLNNTYSIMLKNYEYNSVKLIDFSIKLDHYVAFPSSEMRNLKISFNRAKLAEAIMQRLAINYLYLFPTTSDQKQRILSFLNIPIDYQNEIDFRSRQDKK